MGLPEKLAYCLFGVRIEYRKGSLYEQDAAEAVAAESCPMNLVKAVCLKPSKFVNPHPVQCSLLLILINVLMKIACSQLWQATLNYKPQVLVLVRRWRGAKDRSGVSLLLCFELCHFSGAVAPALKPTSQLLSGSFLRGRLPRPLRWQFHAAFSVLGITLCQKTAVEILSGSVCPLAGCFMESVALCITLLMGSSGASSPRKWFV